MPSLTDDQLWRRRFAQAAMASYKLIEHHLKFPPGAAPEDAIAHWACEDAEALLAELKAREKEEKENGNRAP